MAGLRGSIAARAASLPLGIALLALGVAGCGEQPAVLGDSPDFTLTDQRGAGFGKRDLDGQLWVADFVFTRCASMCPRLTARMAELQEELRADPLWQELRLVSFSVDPEYDRPGVLAEYADRNGADPERWVFLTGGREEIWALSKDGFKLAVGEDPGNADEPLFHSGKFVLVDRDGRIRGYYDALDADGYSALLTDLRRLATARAGRV